MENGRKVCARERCKHSHPTDTHTIVTVVGCWDFVAVAWKRRNEKVRQQLRKRALIALEAIPDTFAHIWMR